MIHTMMQNGVGFGNGKVESVWVGPSGANGTITLNSVSESGTAWIAGIGCGPRFTLFA